MGIKSILFQNCVLAVFALLCFSSCEPELDFENFDKVAKGAFARKLDVSGSYNTASLSTSSVDVTVEFYDQNQGQNVVSYNWTASFKSNGGNNGEDVEAAFIKNLDQYLFHENKNGLPEVSFSFEMRVVLNTLGIDGSTLTADDLFRFEATVITEDGSEFTSSNTGPNLISQSPFGALFRLDVPVVCEFPDDMFVGNYVLTNGPILSVWGSLWGVDGTVITLVETSEFQRSFVAHYFQGHGPRFTQTIDFVCNQVFVVESSLDVGCSEVDIVVGQKGSMPGTFDITDDGSFTVNATDDVYNSCAQAVTDIAITFIKL